MNYDFTLQGHVENLTSGEVMIWSEKAMLHISRSASSAWTLLWCHRSSLSIKSAGRKTAGDLSWSEMTLATWWEVTGRNLLVPGVKSTCKPMFEGVSNGFRPKEATFNFPPLTYNGEVTKLTWPWVTVIKIPRYVLYRYCYGYQSLKVSRWSVIQHSYDEHSNFFWGEVTWRDLTLIDLGRKILKKCA